MNYYSVKFKFEDDYYMTAYCKANNKKEAFTKFTKRYTTCEIKIEDIIKEKNKNEQQ